MEPTREAKLKSGDRKTNVKGRTIRVAGHVVRNEGDNADDKGENVEEGTKLLVEPDPGARMRRVGRERKRRKSR